MAGRSLMSLLALLFIAGTVLFQFFIVLSGGVDGNPENQIYFLEANTDGIPTNLNPARWTFLALCGVENGRNANCQGSRAAFPFDPASTRNFGTTDGIPDDFLGQSYYFYMSRFAWVFYIIALFFAVVTLFIGLLALCTRIGAYLSAFTAIIALFFQTIAAALMTAWSVKARNAWRRDGHDSHLGVKAYAFTWTSVALLFLATLLFCMGGKSSKSRDDYGSSRGGFFRKRGEKRGSFYETESQRHVRDNYS